MNNIELCQEFDPRDSQLRSIWNLEAMGITDTDNAPHSIKDTAMLSSFSDSFRIEDGRTVVSLPKKEHVTPADKHTNAPRRFQSITKMFSTTTDFRIMYEAKTLDYILQHQVEVAPPGPSALSKFYLPHHAVTKEKRKNIKWRIVFDASSHEPGFPSLNDSLRFRLYACAIFGDVSQAFLQITLQPTDRDLTQFLLYRVVPNSQCSYHTTDEVITYRFTRLPFGLTCSPFLLSAPIHTLATIHHDTYPTAGTLMDRSTYMDDFAASATHDDIFFEVTSLMNTVHLPMYRGTTDYPLARHLADTRFTVTDGEASPTNGLGNPVRQIHIDHTDTTRALPERPATKRQVL